MHDRVQGTRRSTNTTSLCKNCHTNMIQVDLFMNNIGTSFKVLDATSDWLTFEKQDLA